MDLMILNEDFKPVGLIDQFNSLQWVRKYYEVGEFELHAAASIFPVLQEGSYVYRPDTKETALIETVYYDLSSTGSKEVSAKGRMLEQLLANRVIDKMQNLKGTAEEAIRGLVNTFAVKPTNTTRKIARLRLGDAVGLGSAVEMQCTGDNLLDKIQELALSQQLSIKLTYEFLTDELVFVVWQGKARTENQTENPWATFSADYENVLAVEFTDSVADYKNFAFVAGEGEENARIILEIDQTNGEMRRELYVDARDLQRTQDDGSTISMAAYQENLRQRGLEKLAEYKHQITLDGALDDHANLLYRVDFDLGDICTYIDKDFGVAIEQRITELTEVYEGSRRELTATFGDQQLTLMKKVRREVKS